MLLIAPPHPRQPARLRQTRILRRWLSQEWHHWKNIPPLPLMVLLFSTLPLVFLAPLLPVTAYLLWRWASSSWDWRDRWSSIWVWAKQGSVLVALLIILAVLGAAHVWIISRLLLAAQVFWETHFFGDLSLSPLDLDALPARTLLLLPLAPLLALCYEWLDPRTCLQLQRMLTPGDLAEPQPATDTLLTSLSATRMEPSHGSQTNAQAASVSKGKAPQQPKPRRPRPSAPQTTPGRILLAETDQDAKPLLTPQKAELSVSPESLAKTSPPASADIDWDDLAE